MHPLGVVPETTVEYFDLAVVLETSSLSLSYSEATYLGRMSTDFSFTEILRTCSSLY